MANNPRDIENGIQTGLAELAGKSSVKWNPDRFFEYSGLELEKPCPATPACNKDIFISQSAYDYLRSYHVPLFKLELPLGINCAWRFHVAACETAQGKKPGLLAAFFKQHKDLRKKYNVDVFSFDCCDVFFKQQPTGIDVIHIVDTVNETEAQPAGALNPPIKVSAGVIDSETKDGR